MRSIYLSFAFLLAAFGNAFRASAAWVMEAELPAGSFMGAGTFFGTFDFDDSRLEYANVSLEFTCYP